MLISGCGRSCLEAPFFALALCWCAWTMESSNDSSSSSSSRLRTRKILSRMPSSIYFGSGCEQSPPGLYRSGRSRQGVPLRAIQMIPLWITRLLFRGRPCLLVFSGGRRSLMRFHSSSVSPYRLNIRNPPHFLFYHERRGSNKCFVYFSVFQTRSRTM